VGISIKGPAWDWVIRGSAIIGAGARPSDRDEIYGNFFFENPVEALFQGDGNVVLHDNVLVHSFGNGIRVTGGDPGFVKANIGNTVFAGIPIVGPDHQGNVTDRYAAAADYLVAPMAPLGVLNLYPKAGQLIGETIYLEPYSGFVDGKLDFNGAVRIGVRRGAYEGEGSNPGWRLERGIKPSPDGSAGAQSGTSKEHRSRSRQQPSLKPAAQPTAVGILYVTQRSRAAHHSPTVRKPLMCLRPLTIGSKSASVCPGRCEGVRRPSSQFIRRDRDMKRVMQGIIAVTGCVFAVSAFAGEPNPPQVPEPGTLGLLAAGIAAVVAVRLIKRK